MANAQTSEKSQSGNTASQLPPFPHVPLIRGRILIGGSIRTSGFEMKTVVSNSWSEGKARNESGGTVLGETPHIGGEIFMEAVDSAVMAWGKGRGDWPTARMEDRIQAVSAFRDRMQTQREIICRLLMWEIGKNWTDAQAEFDRTIQYINDTIEEVKVLDRESSRFQFAGGILAQIRRAPLGVTLCMGPFNYPLNETFTTLIPALIMGNTVIVKISRYGELFWDTLLEAFRDSFPPGVANIINGKGREIVGPAVRTGKIDVLAFIGSSKVANQIKLEHPHPHRFRSILALEAKNPAIILADADLENAVNECVKGALSFNGQRCTALKMILVHKSRAAEFTKALVAKIEGLVRGMPWDPKVQITPLPDSAKADYLRGLIDEAVKMGGRLANPERGAKSDGALFHPAVVTGVDLKSKLAQEEQFGPLIPIREFSGIDEVEDYIVNSQYGSQASIFGSDPVVVGGLIDRLTNQVCRINLNSQCQRGPDVFPFTGRKASAEGTLSVFDALRAFSIRTMVAAKQDTDGKKMIRGILRDDSSRFLSNNIVL